MQKYKKCKVFFYGVLLGVFLIEGGMRFAIWHSLNKIVPKGVDYSLSVSEYTMLNLRIGCLAVGDENYMAVPYTFWMLSRFTGKFICNQQGEHIQVRVIVNETFMDYHWSFHLLSFEEDSYN